MKKTILIAIVSLILSSTLMFGVTNPKLGAEIEMSPAHPNLNSTITFRVRVLVKIDPVDDLVLKGSIDGSQIFIKNFTGTTPAGYDEYIEFQWNNPAAGNHTVTVDLDPNNLITEDDETDNHLEKTFSVRSGSFSTTDGSRPIAIDKSKLTITKADNNVHVYNPPINIWVKPEITRALNQTSGTDVWNISGYLKSEYHDLNNVTVEIRVASSTANCIQRTTVNLRAGELHRARIDCILPQGQYTGTIIADPNNVLKEKDRSDNTRVDTLNLVYVQ